MQHHRWLPPLGFLAAVFLLATAPGSVDPPSGGPTTPATPGAAIDLAGGESMEQLAGGESMEQLAGGESAQYLRDDETCLSCHDDMALARSQIHARIESFEVLGRTVGCESCHGPGSLHAEDTDPELITRFSDETCMDCHLTKGVGEWHASTHAMEGVGCADCHTVHVAPREAGYKAPLEACQSCHSDVLAQFQLPSHHPVREGKMDCASCHDVHSANERMLISDLRPNDTCYKCHQHVEGPFIFEHAPVQDDCRNCHVPHGSVANNLLTANQPALCLQCHDFHFHAGYRASEDHEVDVGGFERENPFGTRGMNIAFTTSCTQCHVKVHGSDLPSQSVPGMGRGLTQ